MKSFFTPENFEVVLKARNFCSTGCALDAFKDLININDLLANRVDEVVKAVSAVYLLII